MNSKNSILESIKKAKLKPTLEPTIEMKHVEYADKDKQFSTVLKSVGGLASWLTDDESIEEFIEKSYEDLDLIGTNLDLNITHIKPNDIDDPHTLKDIDLAIIKGEFAVAENGAVWVKEDDNTNRALYFIARKLLIVIEKNNIVSTMHEAYKKIKFEKSGFGLFISGPSKTADIEQALVIGAHGAMECRVLFV